MSNLVQNFLEPRGNIQEKEGMGTMLGEKCKTE